jgi:hypothetical protein
MALIQAMAEGCFNVSTEQTSIDLRKISFLSISQRCLLVDTGESLNSVTNANVSAIYSCAVQLDKWMPLQNAMTLLCISAFEECGVLIKIDMRFFDASLFLRYMTFNSVNC